MTQLYRGPVKVMNLNINNSGFMRINCFDEHILIKDSLFYKNKFGNIVNFRYDNHLASRSEAIDYLSRLYSSNVLFVDYDELQYYKDIQRKEFKQLIKTYKNIRRNKRED